MKKCVWLFLLCVCVSGCAIARNVGGLTQAKELHTNGLPAHARILEIADSGWTVNDDPVVWFLLEVYPEGKDAYQARTKLVISRVHIPQYQPGAMVPVRIDPGDPDRISLDIYEF